MGIWWGEGLWGEFRGEASELEALRAFVPGFRRAVWSEALTAVGASEETLAQELAETYRTARRARQLVDAEAERILGALARNHRLALVSNGAPDVQREKLAGTTLGRYFSAIVISCYDGTSSSPAQFTAGGTPTGGAVRLMLEAHSTDNRSSRKLEMVKAKDYERPS